MTKWPVQKQTLKTTRKLYDYFRIIEILIKIGRSFLGDVWVERVYLKTPFALY